MKHIFVINPAAGKENSYERIKRELEALDTDADWELYQTKGNIDATEFVRTYCKEHREEVRFYACGGDGTLHEVVNGAVGFAHASVGCYPCGSGNDFVKYYGGKEPFLNLKEQLEAPDERIDLMRVGEKYAVNATHFGFDTCVAKTMQRVRRKKLIGGKHAYTTGVVVGLLRGMKNTCTVTADGEVVNPRGKILLCTVTNGQYVGGSFRCAPRSLNNDGKMELCLVTPVSIFTFLRLVGKYTEGKHLDNPKFQKFIRYRRVQTVRVQAPEGFLYSLDGELLTSTDFTVETLPAAVRFAVPRSAKPLPGEAHVPLHTPAPALV